MLLNEKHGAWDAELAWVLWPVPAVLQATQAGDTT